jgi:hypothetical protein
MKGRSAKQKEMEEIPLDVRAEMALREAVTGGHRGAQAQGASHRSVA